MYTQPVALSPTEVETCLCQTPGRISAPCAYVSMSVRQKHHDDHDWKRLQYMYKKRPNPWEELGSFRALEMIQGDVKPENIRV